MLAGWKTCKYITEEQYRHLYCSDELLPRTYAVPKIHKPNYPFRIIVSSINSPLYFLASFLQDIMYKNIPKADSYIKNSFQMVENLRGVRIEENYKLISH